MQERKLIHPYHFRSVASAEEAERLMAQGWLELTAFKSVTATAIKQRAHRRKRRELGHKRVTAYLELETFNELMALKKPGGETNAELFTRLVKLLRLL